MSCKKLLDNVSIDTTGTPTGLIQLDTPSYFTVHAYGNFDGATIELQVSPDPNAATTTWYTLRSSRDVDVIFLQPGYQVCLLNAAQVRAKLSNAGTSTLVTVEVL